MEFEIEGYANLLYWAFGLAFVLGAVANKTNFCTMGAVSDWVNMGDMGRMRAWVWAMAVGIIGVGVMEYLQIVDMSLTTDNAMSNPPYRTTNFVWPRYIVGGLLFGIGMTMGSGCGNKTMVRIGAGNVKSLLVLAFMSLGAWAMMFTDFMGVAFLNWMAPISPDLATSDIIGQDIGSIVAGLAGSEDAAMLRIIVAAVMFLGLAWFVFKDTEFRGSFNNILGGTVVGAVVVAAWWVSAGDMGVMVLEEADMADTKPYAMGAQSFTFVAPAGHLGGLVASGFSSTFITFALAAGLGVIVGSLVWALVSRSFRVEWFVDFKDVFNHALGGLLMGVGGVLSMGCTIGQAVSGASTVALGAFLTFFSLVLGAGLTMKVIYYRMLDEDASFLDALITGLVDFHLLPKGMRKVEDF